MRGQQLRIGFVSTRLAGTDGVSLETQKWVSVLTELNHECFYFAGESEWPDDRSYIVPEAHFNHPDIQALNKDLFDNDTRSRATSRAIQRIQSHLKGRLYNFVQTFDLGMLIVENALSIPMNIPLGVALAEFVAETRFPTIGHHHDFAWERGRFKVTAASDYQRGAFPPIMPSVYHVVINSYAARQLALRTGATSMLIPNVMDFESPPPEPDGYADDLRSALGIGSDEYLLLQPTRVVPRKRIEQAIELARRLNYGSCAVVISHSSGDEGTAYETYLQSLAELLEVRVIFASGVIGHRRGQTADGRKIYSLADIYHQADLVTYPSTVEGFGNAFLETLYYSKPIVMCMYEIFKRDIEPKGFRVVGFKDFVTDEAVRQARVILEDPAVVTEMTAHNYELGRRYYSYHVLRDSLAVLLNQIVGL
jgi:glycosyltransferase involved in cell wall biosynthesis